MKKIEFNEVMNVVGINNPLSTTTGRYGSTEEVHYWNNLAIWFSGSYYAIIRGKIPYEVANIIYQKYSSNFYEIRVEGGCSNWNPIDWAVDEQYEKEIKENLERFLGSNEYIEKCELARENLYKRNNDDKYITTYHIDKKEGLLIFLIEMKDYFLRKNNLLETEVEKYDELISKVVFELLKKINPSVSAYEWMQGDSVNRDNYNLSVERDNKTKLGQMFRNAILDFDKAVNPFLNEDVNLVNIKDYLQNVNMSVNSYRTENGKTREGCCSLEISCLDTNDNVNYYRSPEGFSFQLMYKLGNKKNLSVLHYYSTSGNYESDKGEVIAINYYGDNVDDKIDIRLNITNGRAGKTYEDKIQATPEQIAFVYDELIKATSYASKITIEKMKKNSKKQLILKK